MAKTSSNDIHPVAAWLIRIVGIVAIGFICFWAFFFFGFGKLPITVNSLVVGTLENPEEKPMEDATPFIEINYLKNTDGSGKPLFEAAFNSYATQSNTKIKQQGIQCYGGVLASDRELMQTEKENKNGWVIGIFKRYYEYYTRTISNKTFFDVSTIEDKKNVIASMNPVTSSTKFLLQVENADSKKTNIALKFRQKVRDEGLMFDAYESWLDSSYKYDYAGLDNFLVKLQEVCDSADVGTTWQYLDLSLYLNAYYDLDGSGEYKDLTSDINLTYVLVKINVSNQGCQRDAQSLFGKIARESNTWEFDVSDSAPFWKFENNVFLTNESFDVLPTLNADEFTISVKRSVIKKFAGEKDLRINVDIDVAGFDKKVVGISTGGLLGLDYNDITIKTTPNTNFKIFEGNEVSARHLYKTGSGTVTVEGWNIQVEVKP